MSATSRFISRYVRLLVIAVLAVSSCGSESNAVTPTSKPLTVTTSIALLDGAPATIDELLFVRYSSTLNDGMGQITVNVQNPAGDAVGGQVFEVSSGDMVEIEGWTVQIERVDPTAIYWWATSPDGERFGGEPKN